MEYEDSRDAQDAAKDLDGKRIAGKEATDFLFLFGDVLWIYTTFLN